MIPMKDEYFDLEQAQNLRGVRLTTNREFAGIPEGTTGIVTELDCYGDDEWAIGLSWTTENGNRIVDWFSKTEYIKYLVPRHNTQEVGQHEQ